MTGQANTRRHVTRGCQAWLPGAGSPFVVRLGDVIACQFSRQAARFHCR